MHVPPSPHTDRLAVSQDRVPTSRCRTLQHGRSVIGSDRAAQADRIAFGCGHLVLAALQDTLEGLDRLSAEIEAAGDDVQVIEDE